MSNLAINPVAENEVITNTEGVAFGISPKSDTYFNRFFQENPTMLASKDNSLGQKITFYEHPRLGEDAPIMVEIGGKLFTSEFWDTEDMLAGDDYEPILSEGRMFSKWELGLI